MSQLLLTLSKKPFDVMVTGEKKREFRNPSKWIFSRLKDKKGSRKEYETVKFINGYGKDKPYFIAEYIGFYIKIFDEDFSYSNSLLVNVKAGDIVIYLGDILETGNLKT